MGGSGEEELVPFEIPGAGVGLSLKPPIRESPSRGATRGAVNQGAWEVPLPPARVVRPALGSPPSPSHLCGHPWRGTTCSLARAILWEGRLQGCPQRSLKGQDRRQAQVCVHHGSRGLHIHTACPTLEQGLRSTAETVWKPNIGS